MTFDDHCMSWSAEPMNNSRLSPPNLQYMYHFGKLRICRFTIYQIVYRPLFVGRPKSAKAVLARTALKKCSIYDLVECAILFYMSSLITHQPTKMAYCRFGGKSLSYYLAQHTVMCSVKKGVE